MANTMVRMILTIVKLCPKDSLVKLYNIARKIRYMPRGIHNSLELSADLFFCLSGSDTSIAGTNQNLMF